jgi:iron complex transport system permease protein
LTRYFLLLLLLVAAGLAALSLGTLTVDPLSALTNLGRFLAGAERARLFDGDASLTEIFLSLRLPRLVMALLIGALLALAGSVYQTVLRNPLADPYVLGVSSAAAFFAVLAQRFGDGGYLTTLLTSFAGGLSALALLLVISGRWPFSGPNHLLLVGVMINFFMGALMMLVLFLGKRQHASPELLYLWLGSLSGLWSWELMWLAGVLVVGTAVLWYLARGQEALSLGEEWAASLGFRVAPLRLKLLAVASVMVAAAVACVGMIGFVGLLVPHLNRLWLPAAARCQLPANLLGGALFMVVADTLARQLQLTGLELPVGVVSALFGAPLFVYLLVRR